ncbi:response regulator [Botrimarina hoheduenensis]|uniref:Hydrogenase transcriptional regulatory protein hupR1 n=1 Tax=Botrimarina hoheduenensis TaxID=2528000 RepID=A0A5C5VSR4_9BACT|nr:response regulator [Botrimarina hoheduenensis]TWT40781.1 Hydrogenase transcriptional regulatory protein hupR1 [Botrimarina hoheduenensis]
MNVPITNNRVLLVDDDAMLLASMERCLGMEFELTTELSGVAALNTMKNSESFGVIVSDMRMPVMDGVEFLREAALLSPDSIMMMLTGNQDMQTAVRATREVCVSAFLNKPCDPSEIAAAIRSCLKHHQLVRRERDLLSETLPDLIRLIGDACGLQQRPSFQEAEKQFEAKREAAGIPDRWEYRLAATLAFGGLGKSGESLAELGIAVREIPRLSGVGEMLIRSAECAAEPLAPWDDPDWQSGRQPETLSDEELIPLGAALLHATREEYATTNR